MDIVTFRTFLAAAATGSFTAAAQRVHASPSSVTERIQLLEHRLGARLFDRDKRGCRLTGAGKRFLDPAMQAVRAWDVARHDIALPDEFTRSVAFGGQYALWNSFLGPWLGSIRATLSDVAFRVTAGASGRLSRDLAEGFLDMCVLYDPVFRRDIAAEKLFDDHLVLVSATADADWREKYVRIEWGQSLSVEIASRLELLPQAGLILDLGMQSAQWLVDHQMAGYMPARLVMGLVSQRKMQIVEDMPTFEYPAYACWRRDMNAQLAAELVRGLQDSVGTEFA